MRAKNTSATKYSFRKFVSKVIFSLIVRSEVEEEEADRNFVSHQQVLGLDNDDDDDDDDDDDTAGVFSVETIDFSSPFWMRFNFNAAIIE